MGMVFGQVGKDMYNIKHRDAAINVVVMYTREIHVHASALGILRNKPCVKQS